MYNILLNADQSTVDQRFAAFIAKCEAENDAISRRYEQEQAATLAAQGESDFTAFYRDVTCTLCGAANTYAANTRQDFCPSCHVTYRPGRTAVVQINNVVVESQS